MKSETSQLKRENGGCKKNGDGDTKDGDRIQFESNYHRGLRGGDLGNCYHS